MKVRRKDYKGVEDEGKKWRKVESNEKEKKHYLHFDNLTCPAVSIIFTVHN